MKIITNSLEILNSKIVRKIFTLLLLFITFVVFHSVIEGIIDAAVVKNVLSKVESKWYNDIIFYFLCLFSLAIFIIKINDYTPSLHFIIALTLITLIYLHYRFLSKLWDFYPCSSLPIIKYADLLVLITIENLILLIPFKRKSNVTPRNTFFDDKALCDESGDAFGYNEYAKELAAKVQMSSFESSFSIGINGKWGSGKTSFINLFRSNFIDKRKIIEVDFNPWNSLTSQAIIKDFFETLQEKIKPYHSTIPRLLRTYSSKLVELDKNGFTRAFEASVSIITGLESLNQLFSDIDKALKEIDKKIIIYIDDIDRLNKDEIVEVIRLIRNTANFRNTFFVVAYDRNYVIKALDSHNPYNHEQFLEKIFQVEVTLPYYNKEVLKRKLAENLKKAFPEQFHQTINESLHGSSVKAPIYFDDWLETMRDVTRLSNAVCLNLTRLLGEVEIADFLKIEMLRLKYPAVYELLYSKTNLFLKAVQKNENIYVYQLSAMADQRKSEKKDEKYLKHYLQENWEKLSIAKKDLEKVFEFVNSIFSDHLINAYINKPSLSIVFPSKFKRYFAYTLLDDNLSEVEFGNARGLSQDEFNSKILKWLEKGLVYDVQTRFMQVDDYDNREDFEKIIRAIFYFAGIKYQASENIVDFNRKNLFDKLSDYNSKIRNSFYSGRDDNNTYNEFIKSVFLDAPSPFKFEREFIASVMESYDQYGGFPLSKEELGSISLGYLKSYTTELNKIDGHVFQLFWCTKRTDLVTENGHTYFKETLIPDEAKNIMVNFILKDKEGFVSRIINQDTPLNKMYCISKTAEEIFQGWENFENKFINSISDSSASLNEFKTFYYKFKEAKYSHYIKFEFMHISLLWN